MKKLKILILEDEGMIALHIAQVIQKLNCEVIEIVTNYHDALIIADENNIDLIVADIKINGEIDGIQTATVLQKIYKCEIIFITANIDEVTLKNASNVTSLGYLIKPFKEDELLVLLTMAIQRFQQKDHEIVYLSKEYKYDTYSKKLYFNEREITFSKNEKKLFTLLVNSLNNLVTYEYMYDSIWYDKITTDNSRRQLIFKLKKKLPNLSINVIQNIGIKLESYYK